MYWEIEYSETKNKNGGEKKKHSNKRTIPFNKLKTQVQNRRKKKEKKQTNQKNITFFSLQLCSGIRFICGPPCFQFSQSFSVYLSVLF